MMLRCEVVHEDPAVPSRCIVKSKEAGKDAVNKDQALEPGLNRRKLDIISRKTITTGDRELFARRRYP